MKFLRYIRWGTWLNLRLRRRLNVLSVCSTRKLECRPSSGPTKMLYGSHAPKAKIGNPEYAG